MHFSINLILIIKNIPENSLKKGKNIYINFKKGFKKLKKKKKKVKIYINLKPGFK